MKRIWIPLVLCLFLSSCITIVSIDTHVSLFTDEHWEASIEVVLTPEQVRLFSGEVNNALQQVVAELRSQNIEADWQRQDNRDDGNVGYIVSAKGEGLENLNAGFFKDKPAFQVGEFEGQRAIFFDYDPGDDYITQRQTFTLIGGRIFSSNGEQTDRHTVTWMNPSGAMKAVLTEASPNDWLWYTVIGLGAILVVVSALGVSRRSRRRPVLPAVNYCPKCGSPIPGEAIFCPRCGSPR